MKTRFISFIFLFLINQKIRSQEVIDTVRLMCTYRLIYLTDSLNEKQKSTDILHLLIGKRYSIFFSYITYAADSAFKADIGEGKISPEQLISNKEMYKKYTHAGPYSLYTLYIDNAENKIIITDKINITKYIYEEKKEQINWTIFPDTSTILNYTCQKATCSFRGRIYTAWFAPDLPINAGPYKFSGLPGLIVKITDTKNNYSFECIATEQFAIKRLIDIDRKECIETTRSAFRKAFQAMFENPWESLTANTSATISGEDIEKVKAMLQKGIPFNPIELK